MTKKSSIGAAVKQHREEAGLSQDELASRAGVAQTAISAIESGRSLEPRLATLKMIADALGLDDVELDRLKALRAGLSPAQVDSNQPSDSSVDA